MSLPGRLLVLTLLSVLCAPALAANCEDGLKKYMTGDAVSAKKIFERLAKKGDGCAQFNLGLMYYYGHGTGVDQKRARALIEKSAKAGYSKAREVIKNWEALKHKPDLTSGAGKV